MRHCLAAAADAAVHNRNVGVNVGEGRVEAASTTAAAASVYQSVAIPFTPRTRHIHVKVGVAAKNSMTETIIKIDSDNS